MQKQSLKSFLLAALSVGHAYAQATDPAANYPQRPVRVISGSPGSTADMSPVPKRISG